MKVKGILDEDFVNYKECAMFIAFPNCSWKCGKEICQNSPLALSPTIEIKQQDLVSRYIKNPLTSAIVCGGLEPLDSFGDLMGLIIELRMHGDNSPVVVYTGYDAEEVVEQLISLKLYKNIIVKFGRFLPNQEPHFDEVLGVNLHSNNQYAEVLS